jgi:hypothetical protein
MNPAPADLPKLPLAPGSVHHNSLLSFIEHADRTRLSHDSPLFVGTHYEYTTALTLMRFGLALTRVGRVNDEGIDLIGHWVMTPLREPMAVIIQCKVRKFSLAPCHVRDLEGSFGSVPAAWRNKDILGMLASTVKATRGTLEAMSRSRRPMAYVMISTQGVIQQFVWNRAASEHGLEGLGVTVRHTPIVQKDETTPPPAGAKAKPKTAGTLKDIQLTWMGSPIFPERQIPRLDVLGLPASPTLPKLKKRVAHIGRKQTWHLAPKPRGGMYSPTRKESMAIEAAGGQMCRNGRPKGSKNGVRKTTEDPTKEKRRPGRPKGAKNKKKDEKVLVVEAAGKTVGKKTKKILDADADVDKG